MTTKAKPEKEPDFNLARIAFDRAQLEIHNLISDYGTAGAQMRFDSLPPDLQKCWAIGIQTAIDEDQKSRI